ncbi:MAG TPA: hypothetical protein VIP77_15915 [Jiangellaceae bacterium]
MKIQATLRDGQREIGEVYISLVTPDDPQPDDMCECAWLINLDGKPAQTSTDRGLIRYRFGDGEWAAVAAVIDKAGYGTGPA